MLFLQQFFALIQNDTPYNFAGHNLDWKINTTQSLSNDLESLPREKKKSLQHYVCHIVYNDSCFVFYFFQDGVPRAAYKGVVVFRYKSSPRRIFLVGPDSLSQLGANQGGKFTT